MIEPLLLAVARLSTFAGSRVLTAASGFFFEREERLFLITSRHVLVDSPSGHHPDRIEVTLHVDAVDLSRSRVFQIPLYEDRRSVWRQATDSGGEIDVASIELDRDALPEGVEIRPFTLEHLQGPLEEVRLGSALLVVGYPLGFYDTVHHLAVARQATVASAFGVRFQGRGYFLTDARVHRGASGSPVVMQDPDGPASLPWKLLGIHSAQMDMRSRERGVDESLGLNCAWYADILKTLTD
ncbi:trypsin-like peptidase domain-containing protein [Caenimonas sedimenti]|uniref:Trypsin-like peptidase domain-containing protein n=1 Tax=Caenimonas sedimenti TaxID=2596921 RepID=A0A562ZXC2_9BURK|nr:trypsin-like peptidase domain-containing protein [Caenimonas sedimenti]